LSKNPNAIEILKKNQDKIDWNQLSENLNAIELLKENPDKIDWDELSGNLNAIELLKQNPDKIDWDELSGNLNAIELLKENQNKINWYVFSLNPSIFIYDYEKIRKNFEELGEEIIAKALHPSRLFKLMDIYDKNEVYNTYFNY